MQPPNHHHSHIDLAELKAQIVKKLGPEGSEQYFHYLNRFLSLKLSKVEFNNLCLRIVGRDNIRLHNQLIYAILKNACSVKVSLPASRNNGEALKHVSEVSGTVDGGFPGLSNGSRVQSLSHRKGRIGFLGNRTGDPYGTPGPNGKTNAAPLLSAATRSSNFNGVLENGDLHRPDLGRVMQQLEHERIFPDGSIPLCGKDQTKSVVRVDEKEASARSRLQAPLGVPFCPVSIGGTQRSLLPASSSKFTGAFDVLPDSVSLREQIEQMAVAQGLEGVSLESANILNHGLDSYLKRLIGTCIEYVQARSGRGLTTNKSNELHSYVKLINGVRPSHQHQMQDTKPIDAHGHNARCSISLQDFRVSMELNRQKLGEDWPLLLDKICGRAFEE